MTRAKKLIGGESRVFRVFHDEHGVIASNEIERTVNKGLRNHTAVASNLHKKIDILATVRRNRFYDIVGPSPLDYDVRALSQLRNISQKEGLFSTGSSASSRTMSRSTMTERACEVTTWQG